LAQLFAQFASSAMRACVNGYDRTLARLDTIARMSAAAPARYERSGRAAVITIDRPERRNAVDGETADLLRQGLARFERDDEARVLIVTGSDVAFCAGADLKAIETLDISHPDGPMGFTRASCSKPTIAAISGWCLAGGLEIALWCDLRIAAEGTTFGLFERRWGVPLIDGGTQRLPRIVGMGRALELILTGRPVDAEEALRIGLVNEVVPAGGALARSLELAERLAGFPQETMLADRRAAIEGAGLTFAEGLALEYSLGGPLGEVARRGAARFAAGAGRHGEGA
jgi:enoyl-CoA hydratase